MKRFALLLFAMAALACGIQPQSGTWKYSEYTASTNTCNSKEIISNGDGTFKLTNKGDGTFQVEPNDGTDPFPCNVTGTSFNCPERAAQEVSVRGATAKAKVIVTGTFASATSASGTQKGTVTCTGANCDAAAKLLGITFPCTFNVKFTAVLKDQ